MNNSTHLDEFKSFLDIKICATCFKQVCTIECDIYQNAIKKRNEKQINDILEDYRRRLPHG